jgi:hypothetical protein
MRLTLRTLLAWIDGVLPPAEQDVLGGKVAASPVAPKLVERISAAIASPSLPVPASGGPADEPNAVAEFLDNVLPVDQLEPFERVCLESQPHLAEVAACHRLLAEAARDPALTDPPTGDQRRRLIRTVAEGMSGEPEPPVVGELPREAAAIVIETAGSPGFRPRERVARRQRASAWAWFSAVAAIGLLVALGALLARSIWPPNRGPGQESRELAAIDSAPRSEPVMAAAREESPPADMAAAETTASIEVPPAEPMASLPPPVPPLAPADVVPLPAMEGVAEPAVPPADAPASDEAEAEPEAGEQSPPAGRVAAGDPVLRVTAAEATDDWRPAVAGDPLAAGEELLVPAHCVPVLEWGDLSIRLLPGTKAAITTDDDGTPRLEIVFGRSVVWTDVVSGGSVGISAAGLSGTVPLNARRPIGIEVRLVHRPGDDPAAVSPGQQASVFATGGVDWRQTDADGTVPIEPLDGIEPTQAVPPAGCLVWASSDPGMVRLEQAGPEPAWLRQQAPADRTGRAARAAVVGCLERMPADETVVDALKTLAEDRRVENRMAAASTLALVGDYGELVGLLCSSEAPAALRDSQWQALASEAIPLALGRGANAAARLRQAFVARAPAGRGEELFRLACGFSPAELDAGAGSALVAALEDPLLVVRRFAVANLLPLAADEAEARVVYRPDRAASLNDRGVTWWRTRVESLSGEAATAP